MLTLFFLNSNFQQTKKLLYPHFVGFDFFSCCGIRFIQNTCFDISMCSLLSLIIMSNKFFFTYRIHSVLASFFGLPNFFFTGNENLHMCVCVLNIINKKKIVKKISISVCVPWWWWWSYCVYHLLIIIMISIFEGWIMVLENLKKDVFFFSLFVCLIISLNSQSLSFVSNNNNKMMIFWANL